MKNFVLLVAGAFLLLGACTQKVDLEAGKANVKAVIDQYTKVLETEDLEMLSKITAHDADMVNFGTDASERLVGWEALKELMQKQFESTETTNLSVKYQVIKVNDSGKVAWFSEILDWDIISQDQEMKLEGIRVTGVLEKRDGGWVFVQVHYSVPAENTEFPKWVNELRLNASKTLQTEVIATHINIPDNFREGKYFAFCLKGEGSLEKVINPFETIDKMFSSNDWKSILEYQADGHGSSSFAYEKGNYFCNIFVNIDSSCDDEKTNHIPSKFWIEIYCREK